MQREIEAWVLDRNQRQTEINWQFKTEDARIKLKSLYPQLYELTERRFVTADLRTGLWGMGDKKSR